MVQDSYVFRCASQDEQESWVRGLRSVSAAVKGRQTIASGAVGATSVLRRGLAIAGAAAAGSFGWSAGHQVGSHVGRRVVGKR